MRLLIPILLFVLIAATCFSQPVKKRDLVGTPLSQVAATKMEPSSKEIVDLYFESALTSTSDRIRILEWVKEKYGIKKEEELNQYLSLLRESLQKKEMVQQFRKFMETAKQSGATLYLLDFVDGDTTEKYLVVAKDKKIVGQYWMETTGPLK